MKATAFPAPSAFRSPASKCASPIRRRDARCRKEKPACSKCAGRTCSRAIGGCRARTKPELRGDGFFITGDIGKLDERGYVHIAGRAKDLVITGGYNVYPKEVETELDAIRGVIESAVIGLPHPDFGDGVTAVVVCEKGTNLAEADVIDALKDRLAKFKQPKRVFFVDELPRNAMGKVQKNVLRETYARTYARGAARKGIKQPFAVFPPTSRMPLEL